MLRRCYLLLLVICVIISCKKKDNSEPAPTRGTLRVSGYLLDGYRSSVKPDLNKLTDLNLAFANPDAQGEFVLDNNLVLPIINEAKQKDVKVYMSIGGAAAPAHFRDLLSTDKQKVVDNIMEQVSLYGFDGVDVDLEGDFIDENYAGFISLLHAALKAGNKNITAALATWNSDLIHDSTLAKFDYINIMSYDLRGPWDITNPGQHSPYEMAQSDLQYFIQTRHVPADKLLLGVPFYGYLFTSAYASAYTYYDIVTSYPGAESMDAVQASNGTIYYNGIPTIKEKVQLAHSSGIAGVMIWELNQDALGNLSLLNAIDEAN